MKFENMSSLGRKIARLKTENGVIEIPLLTEEEMESNLISKLELMQVIDENNKEELELEK